LIVIQPSTERESRVRLSSQNEPELVEFLLPVVRPESVFPKWGQYVAGVTAEMQDAAFGFPGEISCNIPIGAGLSLNTARELAAALALDD